MASKDWHRIFLKTLVKVVKELQNKGFQITLWKEYRFSKDRKYRFDYAIPELKVGFEYEGRGRHQNYFYFSKDCEKYNLATFLGWKVYRFTAIQIQKQIKERTLENYLKNVILSSVYYFVMN